VEETFPIEWALLLASYGALFSISSLDAKPFTALIPRLAGVAWLARFRLPGKIRSSGLRGLERPDFDSFKSVPDLQFGLHFQGNVWTQ